MAGETKGDNKLFQIIMVVITSIVAPVSVYFITHAFIPTAKTTATLPPTAALTSPVSGVSITAAPDATLWTATAQPTRTTAATPDQIQATPTAQPTGTSAPTTTITENPATATLESPPEPRGLLPANEAVIVDGLEVEVLSKEVQVKDGVASIRIHLRNLSGQTVMFAYAVQSIAVQDAGGRAMEVLSGKGREACEKKDLSAAKKIELDPGQEIILKSVEAKDEAGWCSSEDNLRIPMYRAASKEAPEAVVVKFDGFGPFRDFGFDIKL
jgi:hypothetical protein